jgi:hypothetical protein
VTFHDPSSSAYDMVIGARRSRTLRVTFLDGWNFQADLLALLPQVPIWAEPASHEKGSRRDLDRCFIFTAE